MKFSRMALLAAAIASNSYAFDDELKPVMSVKNADVGLQLSISDSEVFGIQSFESVVDGWQVGTDAGRFAVDFKGKVTQVLSKQKLSMPFTVVSMIDSHSVRVATGFGVADRDIATLSSSVEIVEAQIIGDPTGRTIFVELTESYGGVFDRRVVALTTDGSVLGVARVPIDIKLNTKNDLAVGLDGKLAQARVSGGDIEIVQPIFIKMLAPFVPSPVREPNAVFPLHMKALTSITRADVIRSAAEFVRPTHVFNRNRLSTPSTICSAQDATRAMRYRIAPRAPDLVNGSLSSVLYAYGGSATNANFAAALVGTTKYIGDLCNSYINSSGFSAALPCPTTGAAVGIDCSGFASLAWQVPRFGTSTILNSAGSDIGSATNAKSGDVLNLSGSHMMIVDRPISSSHIWVYEATANNSFDRAVHAIRSLAELSQYRAVRRIGIVGDVRDATISCIGCSGSGGFVDAAVGQSLSFNIATNGSVASIRWFDDALAGAAMNTRQNPDPTIATTATLAKTYSASDLGVRYITAQALHTDGSVTNGRVQVTVRQSAQVACMLSNSTLPSLTIPASGGTNLVPITTTPTGCVPTLTGLPSWVSANANSSTIQVTAQANTSSALRSAVITVANRSLAVNQTASQVANTPPVANFTYTATRMNVQFTDTSSDANGYVVTRAWSFGDGTTSSAISPTKSYASAGTYGVSLVVTDNQGATNMRTLPVTVNAATLSSLNVSRAGSGSGAITGPGINCPGDCAEGYTPGTWVTLTAVPNAGSSFTGWSGGACSGTGQCVVNMTQTQYVTAAFATASTACSEFEPNNVSSSASAWLIGQGCSGLVSYGGDVDWFGGFVAAGTTISVRLDMPNNLDYDLELYGPEVGNLSQHFLRSSALGTGQPEVITYTTTVSGNYAVRIFGYQGAYSPSSSYRLTRTQ